MTDSARNGTVLHFSEYALELTKKFQAEAGIPNLGNAFGYICHIPAQLIANEKKCVFISGWKDSVNLPYTMAKLFREVEKKDGKIAPAFSLASRPITIGLEQRQELELISAYLEENKFHALRRSLSSAYLLAAAAACVLNEKYKGNAVPGRMIIPQEQVVSLPAQQFVMR